MISTDMMIPVVAADGQDNIAYSAQVENGAVQVHKWCLYRENGEHFKKHMEMSPDELPLAMPALARLSELVEERARALWADKTQVDDMLARVGQMRQEPIT